MYTLKICVGVFSGIFKARMLQLGIHMDNELFCCIVGSRIGLLVYPVFFVFVFRLLKICVTVFFAIYILLLIHIV